MTKPVRMSMFTMTVLAGLLLAANWPAAVMAEGVSEPTIYHTVRIELRDDADPARVAEAVAMMKELGDKLDEVESYIIGADLAEDYDIGATYVLKGYDAYRIYLYDPLHLEIDRAGLPLVKNMVSFDITDAEHPEAAAARIAQIHRDRINEVEGLKELLQQIEDYSGAGAGE